MPAKGKLLGSEPGGDINGGCGGSFSGGALAASAATEAKVCKDVARPSAWRALATVCGSVGPRGSSAARLAA